MPVTTMAADSSGTLFATGSADTTVRVWDINKGYCTHSFRDHSGVIRRVGFIGDTNSLRLVSCSEDLTCRIFDLFDSKCIGIVKEHMSLPTDFALSTDGYTLVTCGRDKVRTRISFTSANLNYACIMDTYSLPPMIRIALF